MRGAIIASVIGAKHLQTSLYVEWHPQVQMLRPYRFRGDATMFPRIDHYPALGFCISTYYRSTPIGIILLISWDIITRRLERTILT